VTTVDESLNETPVIGDMNRIKQVLTNFFSNALKFTPHSGTITLQLMELNRDEKTGRVKIRTAVTDTGSGIAEEDRGRVFVPWSQVRSC
jgi:two-component system sensor histidine kinase/response regulator